MDLKRLFKKLSVMPIDTQWFFEVFLAGFMTVWSFRFFSNKKGQYAEFEWFALSGFWGVVMIGLIGMLPNSQDKISLLSNPLATGLSLSILGMLAGYAGSRVVRMRWFRWILDFLGRGGEDKSGSAF